MTPATETTDDYLAEAERRARRFQGAYTGTSGTLAADVIRLIGMVRRASPPHPLAWPRRLIGITGPAGAGKDAVAAAIPGARRVAFADPIYRALAVMLAIPETTLRDRRQKDSPLPSYGVSPRRLLQTLGTEWGRVTVDPDLWVRAALVEWQRAAADGVDTIVVPDVRFPNEARAIRDHGGEVWLVHRPDVAPVEAHASEQGIPLALVDRLVVNGGSLADLRRRVEETLRR